MALSLHIDRIDEQMNTLLEHGLAKSVNYDSGNMVKARQSCSTESASKWCHFLVENLQPTLPPPISYLGFERVKMRSVSKVNGRRFFFSIRFCFFISGWWVTGWEGGSLSSCNLEGQGKKFIPSMKIDEKPFFLSPFYSILLDRPRGEWKGGEGMWRAGLAWAGVSLSMGNGSSSSNTPCKLFSFSFFQV